ncbi:uncharacterized protein LOC143914312 [Arctopsyche grandis]|uniref:uncharacterized protein LOC143914312 n=1 Tax=Arctopsyche grandis TaxID=121162 RepID=UPI00406D9E69
MTLIKKSELRNGSLIIGWLGLVFYSGWFIYAIDAYSMFDFDKKEDESPSEVDAITAAEMSLSIIISIVGVLINVVLVYAAHKSVRMMLIPWLLTMALGFLISLIYAMYNFVEFFFNFEIPKLWHVFFSLLLLGISFYMWLWVYGFYHKVKEEELMSNFQYQIVEDELQILTKTQARPPEYSIINYT